MYVVRSLSCIQWLKDTNLKANHNGEIAHYSAVWAVFNGSKILIWKQITTIVTSFLVYWSCIQWLKDTNLKANHNLLVSPRFVPYAVFNGSKILIWKQITTPLKNGTGTSSCIQWLKDTNLKANHNKFCIETVGEGAVFNGSKILIWKQITTELPPHYADKKLYSMAQRY